jgi:hypothetical protein
MSFFDNIKTLCYEFIVEKIKYVTKNSNLTCTLFNSIDCVNNNKYYAIVIVCCMIFFDLCYKEYNRSNDYERIMKEYNITKNKITNINNVINAIEYNNMYYLKYDNQDEWPMDMLEKKAKELDLPKIYWYNEAILGCVIRNVEQLNIIKNIVDPIDL